MSAVHHTESWTYIPSHCRQCACNIELVTDHFEISKYHPIHTITDWSGDKKPNPTKTWTRRKISSTPESSLWREASPTAVGCLSLSLAAGGRQECGDKGQFSVRNANLRPTHFDSSSLRYLRGRKRQEKAKGEEGSRLPLSGVEYVERERGTKERTMK